MCSCLIFSLTNLQKIKKTERPITGSSVQNDSMKKIKNEISTLKVLSKKYGIW